MKNLTFGRPFVLQRDRDISDVSGTGIIADGIVFPDGHAAIHWRGKWPLTTPHPDGLESILAIHDHGGRGDLHVIWPDVVTSSGEFGADLADIYDLPAALFGTETERAHLHRLITRALLDAWEARGSTVSQPEQHCATFADAVMPILAPLQKQRDQALRANGRAYGVARTWKRAHGTAMFLVRVAGAELSDVLNEEGEPEHDWHHPTPLSGLVCSRCDLAHKFWSGEACTTDRLNEQLAQFHEGEEPYTDERMVPTPAQWIWRWNRATPERRLEVVAHIQEAQEKAIACTMADHEGALEYLRIRSDQLDRLGIVVQDWLTARFESEHGTAEPRHLAALGHAVAVAAGRIVTTPATCGEHDGVCFPNLHARCTAHGDEECKHCHRNPGSCVASFGQCSIWCQTGMHWDTCANRVRGPLAEEA